MGAHVHVMSDLDLTNRRGVCSNCGPVDIRRVDGKRWGCGPAQRARRRAETKEHPEWNAKWNSKVRAIRKIAAERLAPLTCERCKFKAEDVCQLDVDHIVRRADKGEDTLENLAVLCANCHRLKTKLERREGFDFAAWMDV